MSDPSRLVGTLLLMCCTSMLASAQDAPAPPAAPQLQPGRQWVFLMTNFASDERVDFTLDLMQRAKRAGYNGMLVSDVKFDKFQLATPAIVENLRRFRRACQTEGIDFIPCVAPFGYADMLLSSDPNLAEGMPVRNATFVVRGGQLIPCDETTQLINGGLNEWNKNGPVGWTVDAPGSISFREEVSPHEGSAALRQENMAAGDRAGRGRLIQKIAVKPWHYYHVSVWIKTRECTSKDWRIFALDGIKPLNWQAPDVKPTQDWQLYHATFCSLENTELGLYIGCWNGKQGQVWFDDVRIEPGGFVNVIRRDSLPVKITSLDGRIEYEELKDFARIEDPKLGHDPHPGYFTNWHAAPAIAIPPGSRLAEGDRVLASYHFASTCGKPNNINMCMSEPKTYALVEQQVQWMKEVGQPDAYMLGHDEIRMNGWDDTCAGRTCGEILADNVRRCVEIVKRVDPGKPVLVWSDMFDPYHNARATDDEGKPFVMYMAKGNWAGSWEGLPPDVGIVSWLYNSPPSLQFFAARGHQQVLAGFYDADPARIVPWLESAAQVPGVVGVTYTTWTNDYSQLETFLGHVRAFDTGQKK